MELRLTSSGVSLRETPGRPLLLDTCNNVAVLPMVWASVGAMIICLTSRGWGRPLVPTRGMMQRFTEAELHE